MDEKVDNNEIDSIPTNNTEVVDDTLKSVESSDTNEKIEDTNQDVVENGTKEEPIKEENTQVINNTQAENIVTSVPNISNTQVINPVLSWQNKDNDKLSKKKIILYSIIGGVVLLIIIFLCIYFFVIKKNDVKYEVKLSNTQTTLTQNEMINIPVVNSNVAMIYKSDNEEIATIDEKGLIKALLPGTTTITITPKAGGSSAKYTVTVLAADPEIVGLIEFEKTEYSCREGESIKTFIKVTSKDEDAEVLKFNVDNTNLADVKDLMNSEDTKIKNVEIECNYEGETTLSAVSTTGATTSAKLKIDHDPGGIRFDRQNYTCIEGDKIEAKIIASGGNNNNKVSSYNSSNTSIVTISKKQTATTNEREETIQITCVKEGDTKINATSTSGATVSSNVEVGSIYGKINLDKKNYSCTVGGTIRVKLNVSGGRPGNRVDDFSVNDSSVVRLKDLSTSSPMSKTIQVQCLKAGTVTLRASSTAGASTSATIKVNIEKGKINFQEGSYTCKMGETINTSISVSGGPSDNKVKSYSSNDSSIASIREGSGSSNTRKNVIISCENEGTTILKATSNTGVNTEVSIRVNPNEGTISFDKSSYSCTAGDSFTATVSVTGGGNSNNVSNFYSNNTSVATVSRESTDGKTTKIKVNCISSGSTSLTAQSATGVKANASISVSSASTPEPSGQQ